MFRVSSTTLRKPLKIKGLGRFAGLCKFWACMCKGGQKPPSKGLTTNKIAKKNGVKNRFEGAGGKINFHFLLGVGVAMWGDYPTTTTI